MSPTSNTQSDSTRFARAFSLANLILLPAWTEMAPGSALDYFIGLGANWTSILAMLLNASFLGGLLSFLGRRLQSEGDGARLARRLGMLALSGLALNSLRVSFQSQFPALRLAHPIQQLGWPLFTLFYGGGGLLLVWAIWHREAVFHRYTQAALALFLPLPLVLAIPILWKGRSTRPDSAVTVAEPGPRIGPILLLVFDEWDYDWTFAHRPAGMALPSLDRFQGESIRFTRAYPPANETVRSIPSLLTGRPVRSLHTLPGSDLALEFVDTPQKSSPWSQVEDLPMRASKLGFRGCFINHYHRFGEAYLANRPGFEVERFPFDPDWRSRAEEYSHLGTAIRSQWSALLHALPGTAHFTGTKRHLEHAPAVYKHHLGALDQAVRSRRFDLVIVHWPIPHAPVIADPEGHLLAQGVQGRPLLENLRLVDRTVAHLRTLLMEEGLWDRSTIILTSDHYQRPASDPRQTRPQPEPGIPQPFHRVPLLIKLPHQTSPSVVDEPVNVVLATRLVDALLKAPAKPESALRDAIRIQDPAPFLAPWAD